jgi:hypothetical protein
LERLELIAGITGTISSEGRARGGNVAPLPDNLSPKLNTVDEVRAMEMENTMLRINRTIRLSVAKRKGDRTMIDIRSLEQTSLKNYSWNKAAK